jgi:hypothetical protein
VKIERVHIVDPGDPLDADQPFVHRLVRQPRRADEVADRVDAGFAGAQPFVDDDMASCDRDTGVFDANVFDIAEDADGEDDTLDVELAPLSSSFDAGDDILAAALQGADGGAGVDLDPLFLEGLAGEVRDLFVLLREHPIEHLDDRHLHLDPRAAYRGGARGPQYAMAKVGKSYCKEAFARASGNDEDAPFSAIPVADHLPPTRVLSIAGTAANRCRSQINDGSKSDVDLR